jgi:hypothetical protein
LDWLTKSEYQELNELFQKRHLLSHTEGIVDEKYISKSGDKHYSPVQRIVVKESDILRMKRLVIKVVDHIREKIKQLT